MCPNPSCWAYIVIARTGQTVLFSYPPERIEFDSTKIPQPLVESLEEAITCHANQCFIASAIMIRKTLELLCTELMAGGNNLKEKIKALGSKAILPPDLFNGLDDLRLLGNDAAHIDAQVYAKIGQEELDVSIEFTKEVLKAIYQYSELVAKMKALKKPLTTPPATP